MIILPKRVLYILLLGFVCCQETVKTDKDTYDVGAIESGDVLVDTLNVLTRKLSNLITEARTAKDSVALLNEKIRRIVESVSSSALLMDINESYKSKKQNFSFALSPDTKLAVFTWNTNKTPHHRNLALYINKNKVIPTSLYNNSTVYTKIYTIKSKRGHPIYILHGQDVSKDSVSHYRLDAYSIRKDGLELEKVFPDRRESIVLTTRNNDSLPSLSPDFKIRMEGVHIDIPEVLDTTLLHYSIKFSGLKYTRINHKQSTL